MDNISINNVRPNVLYYVVNESSKASKLVHGSFFLYVHLNNYVLFCSQETNFER